MSVPMHTELQQLQGNSATKMLIRCVCLPLKECVRSWPFVSGLLYHRMQQQTTPCLGHRRGDRYKSLPFTTGFENEKKRGQTPSKAINK